MFVWRKGDQSQNIVNFGGRSGIPTRGIPWNTNTCARRRVGPYGPPYVKEEEEHFLTEEDSDSDHYGRLKLPLNEKKNMQNCKYAIRITHLNDYI